MTADMFTARYADSIFNEDHFPTLGGGCTKKNAEKFHGVLKASIP
jgi:hypothetical protein